MRDRFEPGTLRLVGSDEVTMVGSSRELTARVTLRNEGTANAVLRTGVLMLGTLAIPVEARGIVAPGAERSFRVRARPEAALDPGGHEGELEIAGTRYPVRAEVVQAVRLQAVPSDLVVDAVPGATSHHVVVTNVGDVTATIGPTGRLGVEAEPEDETDPRRHLVQVASTPVSVEPGRSAGLDITIEVPDDLPPSLRWQGVIPLATLDLRLVLLPPAEPRQKTKKRAAATKQAAKRGAKKKRPAKQAASRKRAERSASGGAE